MKKTNLILDCDPGHDDAIALMLAHGNHHLNLLGVTVVSGNQTIEKTSQNALNLCKYLNINVPIAKGNGKPLVRDSMICSEIHGESGLDGFKFPKYAHDFDKRSAAELICDLCLNNEDVVIAATGPLTNVALAISYKPEIIPHIREIVFMGGSIDNGNVSPAAEFNILCDPEAAHIVLGSGVKVTMIGLNVTRKVLVYDHIVEEMKKLNNTASELFYKLMKVFNENQRKTFHIQAAPLHDPVTIASLIDEHLLTYQDMNVEIDLSHGSSYGRTNCDVFGYLKRKPNCRVAIDIDVNRFWDIIEEGISSYGK